MAQASIVSIFKNFLLVIFYVISRRENPPSGHYCVYNPVNRIVTWGLMLSSRNAEVPDADMTPTCRGGTGAERTRGCMKGHPFGTGPSSHTLVHPEENDPQVDEP